MTAHKLQKLRAEDPDQLREQEKNKEEEKKKRSPEFIPTRGIYAEETQLEHDRHKKFDELKLEQYLQSPFEEIDELDEQESERLANQCKMKFAGDDSMLSQK